MSMIVLMKVTICLIHKYKFIKLTSWKNIFGIIEYCFNKVLSLLTHQVKNNFMY